MDKFWACRLANDGTHGHKSLDEAKRAAEGYARECNRKVYVMESVASCEVVEPVKWES